MKANHIPVKERLEVRIRKLEYRQEAAHVPSHSRSSGNPYWMCRECHIHDPELSCRDGKHFSGCSIQGIAAEIRHYQRLLAAEV